jgi:hypothetical protein
MYRLNINANSVNDAIDKMSRWGYAQDIDYVILPTNA